MKFLRDLLTNDKGFYSANMVMRFGVFLLGCGIAITAVVGDFLGVTVRLELVALAWSLAFGLTSARIFETFLNRKTADDSGAPLQQKGTEESPAEPVIPVEKDDLSTLETEIDS